MRENRQLNNHRGSKLDSANLLVLGMEALSIGAVHDNQRLGRALTCAALYTIVVELVVKHIWEQERNKAAKHTHDIYKLFEELKRETKEHIECIYKECCCEYESAIRDGKKQLGSQNITVEMVSLEEALKWNKKAMINFKYEMTPHGKSVPTGMFWDSQTVWIVPGKFPNFAIELVRRSDDILNGAGR